MTNENDDYKVGYGRPPLNTRFEKGRSGNPKGRRSKSARSSIPFREILEESQVVQIGGRKARMSKGEILVRKLLERALQGEAQSTRMLLQFMANEGMVERTMTPAFDLAGVNEELERRLMKLSYSPAPGAQVASSGRVQEDDG